LNNIYIQFNHFFDQLLQEIASRPEYHQWFCLSQWQKYYEVNNTYSLGMFQLSILIKLKLFLAVTGRFSTEYLSGGSSSG
jgi:hypothetical protein